MADGSLSLQKLSDATRMLAEVRDAKDAKSLMDLASAAKHYAKKHKLGKEAIGHAHSIEIDAMAMLGKFRMESPKAKGGQPYQKKSTAYNREEVDAPTNAELNLSERESASSQLLATVKEEQPEVFEQIKSGEKTVTQVKRERTKAEALKRVIELPSGKFRILYADPPWKYGDSLAGSISENYGSAEKHYPAMSITELCNMPMPELDTNAVLFLWVTSPLIFECHPLIKAWGFSYKAMFVWDKIKHNMGHYNSVRHELLLICTRGQCPPDDPKLIDSVVSIERTKSHSQKPEEFRQIIDAMYPHGRRLELFARGNVPSHWEKWGTL